MAAVYEAYDQRHNRSVAVKILDPEVAAAVDRARFLHEINTAASLSHPNILPVFDSGDQDGTLYYVMPHIRGETLREIIERRKQIPLDELVRLAGRIAVALDFAHARGVVHRDIKPANIILFEGEPLILDFGIAKALVAAGESNLTKTGISVGTPAYLSPEQATADQGIDGRSDQYSLACVIYEMASGTAPFTAASAQGVIAMRFTQKPRHLRELLPDIPQAFSDAILKAMSLEPHERFETVGEFVRQLSSALSQPAGRTRKDNEKPSLAVLPFSNMSSDPDNEFFADGITEDLINSLTRLGALRITSRTASFAFKGKGTDLDEVARRLKVDHILEGGVRKAGNHLRVTVQLIDAPTGNAIWSDRYDRELADVFAIQDEISSRIVDALELVLSSEHNPVRKAPTGNVRAYEYYLRGRQLYHQRRPEAVAEAVDMYRRAIELDRNYALAYAGMADAMNAQFGSFGAGPEALTKAEAAARRALELDPLLAEAHASYGLVFTYRGQFNEATAAFDRATELDPTSYDIAYHYGRMLATLGDVEKAAEMFGKAEALRPEDYQAPSFIMNMLQGSGKTDEALAAARRTIEAAEHALSINPGDARALSLAATAFLLLGDPEKGRQWNQRSVKLDPGNAVIVMNAGCFESNAGNTEAALDYLERAIELGFRNARWLRHDPDLNNVRDHPRFNKLVERIEKMLAATTI